MRKRHAQFAQEHRILFDVGPSRMSRKRQFAPFLARKKHAIAAEMAVSGLNSAVASVPSSVFLYGFEKIAPAKIRPKLLSDVHLCVAQLPQQKV
jgi:hypothetical protein